MTERSYQYTDQSSEQLLKMELSKAISRYKKSGQTGMDHEILELLEKTREGISQNFHRQNWENAEKTYQYIDQSINDILSIQLTRTDKESWLKEIQGTVSQAAYALVKRNEFEGAVVTLERGLARLLSEALQRDRADLEPLKTTGHTGLYHRYQDFVECHHEAQQRQNLEDLKEVQAELDKTIKDIRQVPGYEHFFSLPEFGFIQAAAQDTPLVYILTTAAGGLALIVRKEGITPVWLQELTTTALQEQVRNYRNAYEHRHQDEPTWFETLEQTTHWLGQILMDELNQPLQSRIRMADNEFLTLEEILTLRLESRLATLSACETGIPGTKLPDEVVSFAAGRLQAGVAGIVASLWSVHELSTALLMVRFYDYWREEQLNPVEALRQAQIWVRDTTNKEKVDYFARKYTDYLSRANPNAAAADAAILLKATIAYHHFQEGARDFEHPYHWAAFGFTGYNEVPHPRPLSQRAKDNWEREDRQLIDTKLT